MDEDRKTRAWRLYEAGVSYNHRLTPDQYSLAETNTEFFIGNQWLHLPDSPAMRNLPKPTFNILKRVASLFIASLTSSAVTIKVEPLARFAAKPMLGLAQAHDGDEDAADFANAALDNLLEKLNFEYRVRDALFAGAQTGDYCAHFWFDPDAEPYGGAFKETGVRGEIKMELVDGINVHFGNPNESDVEKQPYILLVGRDTVANLRAEAKQYRGGEEDGLRADEETETMIGVGGKTELEPDGDTTDKALYCLLYERKGETIHVTKATRTAVIYEDVDTGLSRYPIAWGNWEKQRNQYHGRALVSGLIPNQIFINTMFATAMRHLQTTAFPKVVYNADLLPWYDDTPGAAVGIRGLLPQQKIPEVITTIQAASVSGDLFGLIDKVMDYTKDCLGATDAQMGNVKPDNTSALMVLQTNAEVPLENIRAGLYEFAEQCGAILLDLMGTYYGARPVVVERELTDIVTGPDGLPQLDPATGIMVTATTRVPSLELFDFSAFKRLWLNLRVDVGATTYFSEIAMTQTLDNLRRDGVLDVTEYLERLPDKLIPEKEALISRLKEAGAIGAPSAGGAAAGGEPSMGGALSADKVDAAMPPSAQVTAQRVPGIAQRAMRKIGSFWANRY